MNVEPKAEFKSKRTSNFFVGIGLLLLATAIFYLIMFGSESELLGSRARRGGIIKIIEQAIGWELFIILMSAFGFWILVYAIVSLWKVVDTTPDVRAFEERLEFHPAVRGSPANYEEISYWSVEFVNRHPVLWIHFDKSYWSLQGLFKRKTVKLEGDEKQLSPLFSFFSQHPAMRDRFVR